MRNTFIVSHLCAGLITTVLAGLVYASVQQNYRQGANDPQVQIVHELAERLEQGGSIEGLFPAIGIDLAHSLDVFAVLYDAKGRPSRSSASLNGHVPQPPGGVFAYVDAHGEDRITWQPAPGVRMATVFVAVRSSPVAYAAAGRSLKEVEARESNLQSMVLLGWIICIIALGIHAGFLRLYGKDRK
jgi:hypothetical protein